MPLTPAHRLTVAALGDTMFPSIAEGDPGGGEVLPDALDEFLGHVDPAKAKTLGVLLKVFELGAIAFHGKRFSRLSPEKRERYVDGWMRSRIAPRRVIYRALKQTLGTLYYQDERTWKTLRYDGPVIRNGAGAGAGAKERSA